MFHNTSQPAIVGDYEIYLKQTLEYEKFHKKPKGRDAEPLKPKASDDKSNAPYHADELWVKLKVYLTTTVDGQSPTNLTSKCKDYRQFKKETT